MLMHTAKVSLLSMHEWCTMVFRAHRPTELLFTIVGTRATVLPFLRCSRVKARIAAASVNVCSCCGDAMIAVPLDFVAATGPSRHSDHRIVVMGEAGAPSWRRPKLALQCSCKGVRKADRACRSTGLRVSDAVTDEHVVGQFAGACRPTVALVMFTQGFLRRMP